MRRVALNSVVLSGGLGSAQLFTVVAYWVTARSVGPSSFGQLAAYIGVATLVWSSADLGFNAWLIRELARHPSAELFGTSLGVRCVIAAAAGMGWMLVSGALVATGHSATWAPLLGCWIMLSLLWSTLTAPLRAAERMQRVALVAAIERIVLVLVVIVAALAGTAAVGLVVGLTAGAGVASAVAFFVVPAELRRIARPGLADVFGFLRNTSGFAVSSLAVQFQRLDVVAVNALAGPHAAGIYAAPARLINALGILPNAFSVSVFPSASRDTGRVWTGQFRRAVIALVGLMTCVTIPLFVFAPTAAAVALGSAYRSSGDVLRFILVGSLVSAVNQPLSVAFQARGRERYVAISFLVSVATGLGAIACGAEVGGAVGAAFGFVVLQLMILFLLMAYRGRRGVSAQFATSDVRA